MTYDYAKAATLDDKARRMIANHRARIRFDDSAHDERQRAAIRRIQRLMNRYWREEAEHRRGQYLLRLYD